MTRNVFLNGELVLPSDEVDLFSDLRQKRTQQCIAMSENLTIESPRMGGTAVQANEPFLRRPSLVCRSMATEEIDWTGCGRRRHCHQQQEY